MLFLFQWDVSVTEEIIKSAAREASFLMRRNCITIKSVGHPRRAWDRTCWCSHPWVDPDTTPYCVALLAARNTKPTSSK